MSRGWLADLWTGSSSTPQKGSRLTQPDRDVEPGRRRCRMSDDCVRLPGRRTVLGLGSGFVVEREFLAKAIWYYVADPPRPAGQPGAARQDR
jgi:hypothetical protein